MEITVAGFLLVTAGKIVDWCLSDAKNSVK